MESESTNWMELEVVATLEGEKARTFSACCRYMKGSEVSVCV